MAVAAEHLALADEYGRYSGQPLRELAAELVGPSGTSGGLTGP
jgi:hypothetical protein